MRSAKIISAAMFISLALVLAWAGREFVLARRAHHSLAEMTGKVRAIRMELAAVERRSAAAVRTDADLRATLQRARTTESVAVEVAKKPARPTLTTLLVTDPKVRSLYLRSYRAKLGVTYLPLYHRLGLGAAEIRKFNDLLTEHEETKLDLQATAEAHGLPMSDPAIAAVKQRQDDELRAAEIGLLGVSGYQQVQQVERLQLLSDLVVVPLTHLIPANVAPLTATQNEQLLGVLSQYDSQYLAGQNADPRTIDWAGALPQARGILTDAQYGELQAWSEVLQVGALIKQYYQLKAATK